MLNRIPVFLGIFMTFCCIQSFPTESDNVNQESVAKVDAIISYMSVGTSVGQSSAKSQGKHH